MNKEHNTSSYENKIRETSYKTDNTHSLNRQALCSVHRCSFYDFTILIEYFYGLYNIHSEWLY